MGAKREAALRFVRSGGRAALLTSVAWLFETVRGASGTRIVADEDRVVA
jgi:carbamate kinase